ncbi:MAG: universal stress protein [Bacillota bacterium]|nr:universal stress protein [Bacillota bacterium]
MLLEKIMICTDFSEPSKQLLHCLPEMKTAGLKHVVLMHVVDVYSAGGNALAFQQNNLEKLHVTREELEKMGLTVTVAVPIGFPAEEIERTAVEEDVSLILVASQGKGFIRSRFLGSTTADLMRISTVPLLIEKFKDLDEDNCVLYCKEKFAKVLVPTDFSKFSMNVIQKIKQSTFIGEVVLVSVIETSGSQEAFEKEKAEIEDKLKKLQSAFTDNGIKASYRMGEGTASRNIIDIGEQEQVTLIAFSKRGAGRVRELLVGSTAEALARRSQVPVMIFPANR